MTGLSCILRLSAWLAKIRGRCPVYSGCGDPWDDRTPLRHARQQLYRNNHCHSGTLLLALAVPQFRMSLWMQAGGPVTGAKIVQVGVVGAGPEHSPRAALLYWARILQNTLALARWHRVHTGCLEQDVSRQPALATCGGREPAASGAPSVQGCGGCGRAEGARR